jgi:hypothetical protein
VSDYWEEVGTLMAWHHVNNPSFNISKIKQLIVDFRRNQAGQDSILINRGDMETVKALVWKTKLTARRLYGKPS